LYARRWAQSDRSQNGTRKNGGTEMNISIRPWNFQDIDDLTRHANHQKVSCQLRDSFPYPYTKKSAELFLTYCREADIRKELLLAIDVEGVAAGGISLSFKDDVNSKCAELGYWLGEDFWGKGIAATAVNLICEKGWAEYDIFRIYGEVFDGNRASCRVLEKCGFELEGRLRQSIYKNGLFCDSLIYGKLR